MTKLSRRDILALASAAGIARGSAAANDGEMMWDYFTRTLGSADQRRRTALAALRSRAELAGLQANVKRVMQAGIGTFPERTPLRPRAVGEIRRPDYVIEKIIFESRPQYYITANVYRPVATGSRRPAVVQSCGHYDEGKAAADYQRACIGLAKKGFVALIFDPMGQGERHMFRRPGAKPAGATAEHSLAGRPTLLVGRTLANYRMWDVMRAFDYLESRPDVEASRMGMLGHSGGGMMTILTAPLEPRIRAAMSCCAVTTFYHKTLAQLIADPEQIVPGIYANGVDHPEMIATVAPRAFLIGAVLQDFVPLKGTRRTYDEVRPIYEMLGASDRFAKVESDNTHMLDKNLREACYGWMLKHLAGESGDAREPAMEVETEQNLRCTRTGSVMDLEKARSVFDLNRERARELAQARFAQAAVPAASLRKVLALPDVAGRRLADGRIESEPGIELPITLAKGRRDVLIILAAEQGRKAAAASQFAGALADTGCAVLSVDLRGWGETTCTKPKKAKFEWDEFFAWRAVELGRPLLAMRVQDLLAAVRVMSREYRTIYAVGIGAGGLVVLHAAAVEKGIAGAATYRTLRSYQDVMEQPDYQEPVSSFVPGALAAYDLPDLEKAIGPRPCVRIESTDALRRPAGESLQPAAAATAILRGLHLA